MKHVLRQSRIQHLIKNRNGYLLIAIASILANIVLSLGIISILGREKIVLVPPTIERSFWVTSNHVSPDYLSGMSLYLSDLLLNITPDNVDIQHRIFLQYVDPIAYDQIKTELISEEDHLKKEHITMTFHLIGRPEVNANQLLARITGDIQYAAGNTLISTQRLTYAFTFTYKQGLLNVKSFEEIKKHA